MGFPERGICPECGESFDASGPDWEAAKAHIRSEVPAYWSLRLEQQGENEITARPMRLYIAIVTAGALLPLIQLVGIYLGSTIGGKGGIRENRFAEFGYFGHYGFRMYVAWGFVILVSASCMASQFLILFCLSKLFTSGTRHGSEKRNFMQIAVWRIGGWIPITTAALALVLTVWHISDIATGPHQYFGGQREWLFHYDFWEALFILPLYDPKAGLILLALCTYGFLFARKAIRVARRLKSHLANTR